jgi:hypothetical protein
VFDGPFQRVRRHGGWLADATLTGRSLRDVRSILGAHYLSRDALAQSALRKLEQGTYSQTISQTVPGCYTAKIDKGSLRPRYLGDNRVIGDPLVGVHKKLLLSDQMLTPCANR